MANLSIVYLIVISGFHLSLIQNIFLKIFKNNLKTVRVFSSIFILFYSYLLNFSVNTVRVLFSNIIYLCLSKRMKTIFDQTSIAGILSILIYPHVVSNYGFCMSYLCSIGIIYVGLWKIENYFLNQLAINLFAFIVSLPYVLSINEKVSLFVIINSFIFSYFICFTFIVILLTFWIKWIYPFQKYLILVIVIIINCCNFINIQISLYKLPTWIQSIYNSLLMILSISSYKKINKI